MKHLFILLLLLGSSWARGQTTTSGESETVRNRVAGLTAEQVTEKMSLTEAEINQTLDALATAADSRRLQEQLRAQLYELFDLNLYVLEAEASDLQQRLEALEADRAYEDRSADIQQLKQTLIEVEARLTFRQENRDRIVNQRLQELLVRE
ncbi:MAG: hypothetical protein D6722_07290 [Bacteroidetes bacterium]|nr:MAG: hypothetical protein D6722_07290 [Bacteroidota bacterium]